MEVDELPLPGLLAFKPGRFGDGRGFFSEIFSAERFAAAGVAGPFVQDNHAVTRAAGTGG